MWKVEYKKRFLKELSKLPEKEIVCNRIAHRKDIYRLFP
jgi:mRNA-degrading endonuclease RelE of RelBE toxin-antitoxin system